MRIRKGVWEEGELRGKEKKEGDVWEEGELRGREKKEEGCMGGRGTEKKGEEGRGMYGRKGN